MINFLSLKANGNLLEQYFPEVNVHKNHREILLKHRFWHSRSGWGLRVCIANKLPGDTQAVSAGDHVTINKILQDSQF